jgi:hypothetical protein
MMRSNELIQSARERQQEHLNSVSAAMVQQRIQSQGMELVGMNKNLLATIVTTLVLFVVGTGCTLQSANAAGATPVDELAAEQENPFAITSEKLAATWRIYDEGYPSFIRLNSDQTFQRSHSADMEPGEILDFGAWQFDGDTLTLSSDAAISNCNGKMDGSYRLWVEPYDGIFFAQVQETCEGRLGFGWAQDYAPIQRTGKMCRVDSVAFCDSFIGYEAVEVVQPNAMRAEDKVVAPSSNEVQRLENSPRTGETTRPAAEKEEVVSVDAPSSDGNDFLQN